jgi:hypothetical protein
MAGFGGKFGTTPAEPGVTATSNTGQGVAGSSVFNDGVIGEAKGAGAAGVRGVNRDHDLDRDSLAKPIDLDGKRDLDVVAHRAIPRPACALLGLHEGIEGTEGHAIRGESNSGDGVWAVTSSSARSGVFGMNASHQTARQGGGNGVFGVSTVPRASGVFGAHNNGGVGVAGFSSAGIGVQGGGKKAGDFNGPVDVKGDLEIKGNLDIQEGNLDVSGETNFNGLVNVLNGVVINGNIDWKGPPQINPTLIDVSHLFGLPFFEGKPINETNWFEAVVQALYYLDAQVKVAFGAADRASAQASAAQGSADRAASQAAASQAAANNPPSR